MMGRQSGHGESHRLGDKNELYRQMLRANNINCDDEVESAGAGAEVCRSGTLGQRYRVLAEY